MITRDMVLSRWIEALPVDERNEAHRQVLLLGRDQNFIFLGTELDEKGNRIFHWMEGMKHEASRGNESHS